MDRAGYGLIRGTLLASREARFLKTTSMTRRTLINAHVPKRDDFSEDARQAMALLRRPDQTVNVVLVALTDGVEVEWYADGAFRRRLRFLRDSEARKYMDRLAARRAARGYVPVRDAR